MEASEIVKITELYVDAGKYATEKLIAIAIRVQIVSVLNLPLDWTDLTES